MKKEKIVLVTICITALVGTSLAWKARLAGFPVFINTQGSFGLCTSALDPGHRYTVTTVVSLPTMEFATIPLNTRVCPTVTRITLIE